VVVLWIYGPLGELSDDRGDGRGSRVPVQKTGIKSNLLKCER